MDSKRTGWFGRSCLLVLAAAGLGGCAAVAVPAAVVGGVMLGSLMYTDKLPTDILAERQTGMECDLLESWKDSGRSYCSPREVLLTESVLDEGRAEYCYGSIGGITCYDREDPYSDGRALVR